MLANLPEKRVSRTVVTPPSSTTKKDSVAPVSSGTPTRGSVTKPALQSSGKKGSSSPVINMGGGAKRNLRSTLDAEGKTVEPTKSQGSRKEKSVAENKEVKAHSKESGQDESSTTKAIIKNVEATTNGMDNKQPEPDVAKQAADGQIEDEPGKTKTFMTRLANNTKGIIKKIGRKIKGKKNKNKKANSTTETTNETDSFLEKGPETKVPVVIEAQEVLAVDKEEKVSCEENVSVVLEQKSENDSVDHAIEPVQRVETEDNVALESLNNQTKSSSNLTLVPEDKSKETLQVPEVSSPQISPTLSLPSNPSVLSSPMTSPTMPKRRVRKLNDCIARLTDKLQEKIGKPPSINIDPLPEPTPSPVVPVTVLNIPRITEKLPMENTHQPLVETPVPLDVPLNLSLRKDTAVQGQPSNLLQLAVELPNATVSSTADDCGVVDLSVKAKPKPMDGVTITELDRHTKPGSPSEPLQLLVKSPTVELPMKSPVISQSSASELQSRLNAKGDLVVPHVPKQNNYDVIKIPTFMPQKPLRGSTRRAKSSAVPSHGSNPVSSIQQTTDAERLSATTAIAKITELVADIVRNKKREAALKELAAVQTPTPSIPPVIVLPPVPDFKEAALPDTISTFQVPPVPPAPISTDLPLKETKKNSRKRSGKGKQANVVVNEIPAANENRIGDNQSTSDDLPLCEPMAITNTTVEEIKVLDITKTIEISNPPASSSPSKVEEPFPISCPEGENPLSLKTVHDPEKNNGDIEVLIPISVVNKKEVEIVAKKLTPTKNGPKSRKKVVKVDKMVEVAPLVAVTSVNDNSVKTTTRPRRSTVSQNIQKEEDLTQELIATPELPDSKDTTDAVTEPNDSVVIKSAKEIVAKVGKVKKKVNSFITDLS